MSYWICPQCETASLTWPALRWHFKGKHTGEPMPEKEEIQVAEELPEGYRPIGQYKKGVAAPTVEKKEPTIREPSEIPEELPENFVERTKQILIENEVSEQVATQIINKVRRHPEVQENPNAFSNMLTSLFGTSLTGRKLMGKIGWIVSEVFGPSVTSAPSGPPYPWAQSSEYLGYPQPGGYGYPGAQARAEDPISRWMNYQIWKESKEEEKVKETKLPPALEAKLAEQEKFYQETREDLGTVIEKLNKQEEEKKEAAYKAELAELRNDIRAMGESKKGSGESDWLKAYLAERDKRDTDMQDRYQATIKDLGDKLAAATKDVVGIRQEIDKKVADAITTERTTREQVKKDLEDAGYAPKTKTKEELDHEIQKTILEVVPDKIDKGFDKIIERLPLPGSSQTPQATQKSIPQTPQQIAEQAELEELILDEAKKKSKA